MLLTTNRLGNNTLSLHLGIAMLFDIPDERGGAALAARWGDPSTCRFPLLPFLQPLPMPHMAVVYAALWLGMFKNVTLKIVFLHSYKHYLTKNITLLLSKAVTLNACGDCFVGENARKLMKFLFYYLLQCRNHHVLVTHYLHT